MADTAPDTRPNILMIMVDQLRYPQAGYGAAGFDDCIKAILNFVGDIDDNPYATHFPGFCKLREHAVVLTDHTIAESACIPSRASIMTGQYGPRTGVTQTDGLFKSGDARNFPWLRANGTPTAGDWFRQLGYSTHYFGKWHVSDPPEHTLQGFGFDDWELSWPEPHGALINNLGAYRDYQFAAVACSFLMGRGLGVPYSRATSTLAGNDPSSTAKPTRQPFFAVCSFTNPHDIATYPTLPRGLTSEWNAKAKAFLPVRSSFGPGGSVTIPQDTTLTSRPPVEGAFRIPLNPTGLPQDCATASPSQDEDLLGNNKPRAQYDYAYKLGLGLAAKTGLGIAQALAQAGTLGDDPDPETILGAAVKAGLELPIPFQQQDDRNAAGEGFLQYYAYMIMMVDRHILSVLDALEASGMAGETIVVFASDHGEMGAAHFMMMEKWHVGYQETVNVPVLFRHPTLNPSTTSVALQDAQTSHIDLLPTLLGLAGATAEQLDEARRALSMTHQAAPLPGANLEEILKTGKGPVLGPDGSARKGVMFATDDMITEPLPRDDDPHNTASWQQFEVYRRMVDAVRTGAAGTPPVPELQPGAVIQPCHVRALRWGPWKLVRYCDPWSAQPVPDQWELYQLEVDPTEQCNLLVYDQPFPTVIATLPEGMTTTRDELATWAQEMGEELQRKEAGLLSPYPSEHPTAGASAGR